MELASSEAEAITQFVRDAAQSAELLEVVRSGALAISRQARILHVVGIAADD